MIIRIELFISQKDYEDNKVHLHNLEKITQQGSYNFLSTVITISSDIIT